ncbi:His/Gly/Thr/Pro-type tRNA ligase C-terminal domain-containing protein [Kitasatospora sp. NPDC101801]|uniref:His/Gly/Thr/Pro-type tRNA ligase C-terminal domain-containing protein n=1 Tax=Kitasatospora sp. NPDC101801 TaxID=3364103 RepID=UPI00381AD8F9
MTDERIDVLLDDRNERPGVKFRAVELIGIPFWITVGTCGLAEVTIEVTIRATGETSLIADVDKQRRGGPAAAVRGEVSRAPGRRSPSENGRRWQRGLAGPGQGRGACRTGRRCGRRTRRSPLRPG